MASDIVERLAAGADEWDIAIADEIKHFGYGTEDHLGMEARAVMYREAAAEITKLRAELAEAQGLVIEANNSLFGSQAYFHSIDGGPYHKHHLARAIEDLKWNARATERELAACRAEMTCSTCNGSGAIDETLGGNSRSNPCAPCPDCAVPVTNRPEDTAEAFIQAAVDRSPEPLRRLGEWLANVLDEDEWKTAERMLLGASIAGAVAALHYLEEAILACEKGTALDVLANYRTVRRTVQDIRAALSQPSEPVRCEHCDGTGDVHGIDGEWRGRCSCPAGWSLPEAWELEAAAIFMDHVDDDDTGSVHRVAAFLRQCAASQPSEPDGSRTGDGE